VNSPYDNIPELRGDVYEVTFQRPDYDDSDLFATIQPTEQDARRRLAYVMSEEGYNPAKIEVEHVEQLRGSRVEQLTELLSRFEDHEPQVPDTVKFEFARTLLEVPPDTRREMIAAIPDVLREQILDLFETSNDPRRS
jgi:hypothetical protein